MKIPYVHDIGDYDRNPDVYQKGEYDPFTVKSDSWRLYYFVHRIIVRKRPRLRPFESWGRTHLEAKLGLMRATGINDLEDITKVNFKVIKHRNRKKKIRFDED